jgi:hypothetical protein
VIDKKVKLEISGKYPVGDTRAGGYDLVTINARNSGDQPAYYRIIMKYGLLDEAPANYEFAEDFDWGEPGRGGGLGVIQVAYCTETSVPADGKERKLELAIQNEPGDDFEHNAGWFLAEPHQFYYKIDQFSKNSSPC